MGWDVKATSLAVSDAISGTNITMPTLGEAQSWLVPLAAIAVLFFLFRWLIVPMLGRLRSAFEESVFKSWQLVVLGTTGIILSIASGWTTWDGMRNFTGEPVLSLMITIGIQGVMLIVAWLIGESFATGMNQRGREGDIGIAGMVTAIVAAIVIVGGVIALAVFGTAGLSSSNLAFAAIFVGLVGFIGALQADVIQPYFQSGRVILKNAVLWVMFLSCMATSVFFSFDSLFSTIFPQNERVRAAELRAQNQVSGILSDIDSTITQRSLAEADRLFQSEGWQAYDAQLDQLAAAAQGSQSEIELYFQEQMEARREAIALQQQRSANAEATQVGLNSRKARLSEEITQLQSERPGIATSVREQEQVVADLNRQLDEQRAKTLAEERGVEGSGKVGRGKFWRESRALEARINAQIEVAERRLSAPRDRLQTIDRRLRTAKAELVTLDGKIAELEGEQQTAEQRIAAAQQTKTDEENVGERIDPSRVLPTFERAKAAFRQNPTVERLDAVQQQCAQLQNAMTATPATKEKVRGIDCDPKRASEAAAVVFALNQGTATFGETCAGGERIANLKSTDALFGFARQCLTDSGLPSDATEQLRTQINLAELNRDDKAHRFVVTWNAFQDGNRLAYLALGIAIAIDALVFMSGLFGANAVRSPLSDVPSFKARTASQLEAIIENALLPNKYENADMALSAMRPITPIDGFTHEVLAPLDGTVGRANLIKVLNAAGTIGAVRQDDYRPERYLVRPELFEFVSAVAKKSFESNSDNIRIAELKNIVTVALQPHVGDHAHIVLANCQPITEINGYSSEVMMNDVSPDDRPIVRNTLNAGASLQYVTRDERNGEQDRYYVHGQLYKTLAAIAANHPVTGQRFGHSLALPPSVDGTRDGGRLQAQPAQRLAPPPPPAEDASSEGAQSESAEAAPNAPSSWESQASDRPRSERPPASRTAPATEPVAPAEEPSSDDNTPVDPQLVRIFRGEFLARLGLDANIADRRLAVPGVASASLDAWKALLRHGASNKRLREYLEDNVERCSSMLGETYSSLRRGNKGDKPKAEALDLADSQVAEQLSTMMLFPELGVIDDLIEHLERAASYGDGLAQDEKALLLKLHIAKDELSQADAALPATWENIKAVLDGTSALDTDIFDEDDFPNVAQFPRKSEGGSA